MNDVDDRYQSPVFQAGTAETTRLTSEEWRYAGKIFVTATLGAALLRGVWHAGQWHWQNMEVERTLGLPRTTASVAEFLAMGSLRPFGAVVALFGICMALFLVVRRRAKAGVPPPNHGLFWPMFLSVPLCAPLAGLVIYGAGNVIIWLAYGRASSVTATSLIEALLVDNAHVGFSIGAVVALVYAALGAKLARGAKWTYKWPILVCIAVWFVTAWTMELVAYPVQFVLAHVGLSPTF